MTLHTLTLIIYAHIFAALVLGFALHIRQILRKKKRQRTIETLSKDVKKHVDFRIR